MTKRFENAVLSTKIGTGIPDSYDMGLEDLTELLHKALSNDHNEALAAIVTAFRFGFAMGNRATHSRKLQRL